MFELQFSQKAQDQLKELKNNNSLAKRFKAVSKALKLLRENPKYPSLNTHIFHSEVGPDGQKVFEAYAENHTSGAYRIFFYYGSDGKTIYILSVIPHP